MKRVWIFMIAILAAFSLVMACTTPKAIKSTEEAAKPIPPAEKKVGEEVITAQKPSEVTETEIKEETGKMVIEEVSFLKDIQFDFDDYSLTDQAKLILEKNANWMINNPNAKIRIEGHCDERGTNEYNMALGERRANSAKKYLIKLGVNESLLSTISYGEEKPFAAGHDEEAWAKNRRAHFTLMK
jgi:peptidoglycan-associated lipoprotein